MNLPNYFLADLPAEATLTAAMIREACRTLKENREHFLAPRSTTSLIQTLDEVGHHWQQPNYPFRKIALAQGPAQTGFSPQTLAAGLDQFFSRLNAGQIQNLMLQDLGGSQPLDRFARAGQEPGAGKRALARGPRLLVHITAGTIPGPAWTSVVLGLLVRSAQFVKCSRGASLLPRLFAHSLYAADPKLGACLEIAEWPGGSMELETAVFAEADCVTVTGSDDTIEAIRSRLPRSVRFLGYGHRVSFGYITQKALSGMNIRQVVAQAGRDVAAWDQVGCLSPHVFYIQAGGALSAGDFGEELAGELARLQAIAPRANLPVEMAGVIARRRAVYEVRAAHSPETRLWCSPNSTAWTVVYEADPRFQISCLHRFFYFKVVGHLTEALHAADPVQDQISTVGLAAEEEEAAELAQQLATWGVSRICPLGEMQNPPLSWRHDGRPALADLVTWTDWELTV